MMKRSGLLMTLAISSAGCADRASLVEPDLPQQTVVITDAPAPSSSAISFEIKFMQGMIDHHIGRHDSGNASRLPSARRSSPCARTLSPRRLRRSR
jgi:uncharacterized protein (DUF305 family)